LFDCDNTLVSSEDLVFEVCAKLINGILQKNGKSDRYVGPVLLKEFVGTNFRGMLRNVTEKHDISLTETELDDYNDIELGMVIKTLEEKAEPCPGVMEQLDGLHELKKYKLAVVSSSELNRVRASIKKVGMEGYFDPSEIYSASTSLPKPTHKPDPAVYLFAMDNLGVKPEECVAIEDSRSGATAAMRANIPTIGYVGPYEGTERERMVKVLIDECKVKAIMYHWSEFKECLERVNQK
jgi:HAD superfamily hydrolase (TIGR01509 family)